MLVVLYKWKLKAGAEETFRKAWSEVTLAIKAHKGGLGSRLHRLEDGTWMAYAQWPNQEKWEASKSIPLPDHADAINAMKTSIESSEQVVLMTVVDDLLEHERSRYE